MKHLLCVMLAFLVSAGCLHITLAQDETPATDEKKPERSAVQLEKISVTLEGEDVLKQAGINEWAAKAAKLVTEYYPKFDKLLESEGFEPPKELTIVFRKMDGVAFSTGTQIVISADWIRQQPGDLGMVAHELVHNIQRYPGGRGNGGAPGWVTEGIADYVRHVYFEPEVQMRPIDPDRAKYTDQYQITAAFFMYIVATYDKDFITKLNMHARQRTYSEEIFEKSTGKTLDDLWAEHVEKVLRPLREENKRLVPDTRFPQLKEYRQEFDKRIAAHP
ncbi:MAG: basic secretory family protein [Planctomycetaceae bacterium]|jgi:hypothetical protein|nr:basic secretory family protein [Planctomycetaceae bacterium]